MQKMWNYVLFLRENDDMNKLFREYVNYITKGKETKSQSINTSIIEVVDKLYNNPNNKKFINELRNQIDNPVPIVVKTTKKSYTKTTNRPFDDFAF